MDRRTVRGPAPNPAAALLYGFYGWSGPAFALEPVNEDGTRSPGEPADKDALMHGATDSGCTLTASKSEQGLDFGPWRWACDSSKP